MVDILGLKASQADGIMNPEEKGILETATDESRIKRLAQQILKRKKPEALSILGAEN